MKFYFGSLSMPIISTLKFCVIMMTLSTFQAFSANSHLDSGDTKIASTTTANVTQSQQVMAPTEINKLNKKIAKAVQSLVSPYSQLAIAIWDPQQQRSLFELNTQKLMQPASVMKLFTAVTAIAELGHDYRYRSQVFIKGPIINKALEGDVWINLSGDPKLTTQDLSRLIAQFKYAGIEKINGQVQLLTTANEQVRAPGWVWDDLGICYAAPVSRLILDGNCILAKLIPSQNGIKGETRLSISTSSPIKVFNQARFIPTSSNKQSRDLCQLSLARFDNNQYKLSGCYPSDGGINLAIAVNDVEPYMLAKLEALFKQHQIVLKHAINLLTDDDSALSAQFNEASSSKDEPSLVSDDEELRLIASHSSESLMAMLDTMLKDSNNLIADRVFKTIGRSFYQTTHPQVSDNFTHASKAQLARLNEMGIKLDSANLVDGSGLSRYNAISAAQLMSLIKLIYSDERFTSLDSALPEAGVSGTLAYKRGFQTKLRAKVKAKTGTMLGVANFAGRMQTSQGDLYFVILENGINPHQQAQHQVSSELLTAIMAIYETNEELQAD
ncbi:D-alanyl-D-alanine carboxypeptidase/D-alanyl-D-alanine-endopeptidase [Shewanella denitrificans]